MVSTLRTPFGKENFSQMKGQRKHFKQVCAFIMAVIMALGNDAVISAAQTVMYETSDTVHSGGEIIMPEEPESAESPEIPENPEFAESPEIPEKSESVISPEIPDRPEADVSPETSLKEEVGNDELLQETGEKETEPYAAGTSDEPENDITCETENPAGALPTAVSGDFTYTYSDTEATITKYNGSASDLAVPARLGEYDVTAIGDNAFADCTTLVNVTLPEGVTFIGYRAFSGCTNLASLTLPESLETMESEMIYGTSVSAITIPKNVTKGYDGSYGAIYGAGNLKTIEFEDGIRTIPDKICQWYEKGNIESNITSVILPESVEKIGERALLGCKSIVSINLPSGLKNIGYQAFYGCTDLAALTLPESLETMGSEMLYGTSVSAITIPKNVTKGCDGSYGAMYGAGNLKTIEFEDGIRTIPDKICNWYDKANISSNITTVIIPESVEKIGERAFSGCRNIVNMNLPSGLQEIKYEAFWGCSAVEKASVKNVTTLGDKAFYGCRSLKNVYFEKLQFVGMGAFEGCSALKNLTLPETVTTIKARAFYDCVNLERLVVKGDVSWVEANLFTNDSKLRLYLYHVCELLDEAVKEGIPVELDGSTYQYLDREGSYYEINSDSSTGYVDLVLKYSIAKAYRNAVSNKKVNITLSSKVKLKENSVTVDNKKAEYTYNNYTLVIPVETDGATIHFTVIPQNGGQIPSAAYFTGRHNGTAIKELIGILNTNKPVLTAVCDSNTNKPDFTVKGVAPAQSRVRFFIDGADAGNTSSNKAGNYNKTLTLNSPEEGRTYSVTVSPDTAGEPVSKTVQITYDTQKPVVQEFKFLYYKHGNNELEYDLLKDENIFGTIVFNPSYEYRFKIKVTNPQKIYSIFVTSDRNGKTSKLEAKWNDTLKCFVTRGRFDDNRNYVPGTLGLKINTTVPQYDDTLPGQIAEEIQEEVKERAESLTEEQKQEVREKVNIIKQDDHEVHAELTLSSGDILDYHVLSYDNDDDTYKGLVAQGILDPSSVPKSNWKSHFSSNYTHYSDNGGRVTAYQVYHRSDSFCYLIHNRSTNQWLLQYLSSKDKGNLVDILAGNFSGIYDGKIIDAIFGENASAVVGLLKSTLEYAVEMAELEYMYEHSSGMDRKKIEFAMGLASIEYFARIVATAVVLAVSAANPVLGAVLGFVLPVLLDIMFDQLWENFDSVFAAYLKWIIDPSGYVYSAVTDNTLSGVTASVYYKDKDTGNPVLWAASEYGQINPQTTADDGVFAWDVPEGYWQVKFTSDDYTAAETEWLDVPPPQTGLAVEMQPSFDPDLESVHVYDSYIDLRFNQYMKPESIRSISILDPNDHKIGYTLLYDQTKTALDGTVYARDFKLNYDNRLKPGEMIRITASGSLESAYGRKYEFAGRELTCEEMTAVNSAKSVSVRIGEDALIPVRIAGQNIDIQNFRAASQYRSIVSVNESIVSDNGVYYIKAVGLMYGDSDIYVFENGSGILLASIALSVSDEMNVGQVEYKVSYFGGDKAVGTAPDTVYVSENEMITISENTFTMQGSRFVGWSDGVKIYHPGDTYTVGTSDVVFVAVWEKLIISVKVEAISLSKTRLLLKPGFSETLTAFILPENASNRNVIWNTDNKDAAVVDHYGKVTAVRNGRAVITATTEDGGFTASCSVKVSLTDDADIPFEHPEGIWIRGLSSSYPYTGKAIKPLIKVYKDGTKLTEKTDYTLRYSDNTKPGTAHVTINMKGLYKGSKTVDFIIAPASLSENITADTIYAAYKKNKVQKPKPVLYINGDKLKYKKTDLVFTYPSETAENGKPYEAVGTYKICIKAVNTELFSGTKEVDLVITDKPLMSSVTIGADKKNVDYDNGKAVSPVFTLKYKGSPLTEGKDYSVSYNDSHTEIGNHTVTFIGNNRDYFGEKTFTFRIKGKYDLNGSLAAVSWESSFPYTFGGAKPPVTAIYNGALLTAGKDYSVTYSNNRKAENEAVITVRGKGMYKGTVTGKFTVTRRDINTLSLNIADTAYSTRKGKYRNTPIVFTDRDYKNQKLKLNTDYSVSFNGSYADAPGPGTEIKVTVTGTGNYTGTTDTSYRIIDKNHDFTKAAVIVNNGKPFDYTGSEIRPSVSQLSVTFGRDKTVLTADDYEIIGYFNNIKKGNSAYIRLRGKNEYAGVKLVKFKIGAASVDSLWDGIVNFKMFFRKND